MSDTYVSKSVEIEAMRWRPESSATDNRADVIVAWINANGGEARYESDYMHGHPVGVARIMVRTNSGWAPVAPGWWVIKGSETFNVEDGYIDHGAAGGEALYRSVLDHYLCDPNTFAKRWERKNG